MKLTTPALLVAALSLLSFACGSASSATGPTTPPTTEATPATTPTPTPAGGSPTEAQLIGRWTSTSCGARAYERRIVVEGGGHMRGEERVSPCPPDVDCVWSGIVAWEGTWRVDGQRVVITPNPGASLPSVLHWSPTARLLNEVPTDPACAYSHSMDLPDTIVD